MNDATIIFLGNDIGSKWYRLDGRSVHGITFKNQDYMLANDGRIYDVNARMIPKGAVEFIAVREMILSNFGEV